MMREKLIEAAKEENWGFVDANLPKICNNPSSVAWAENMGLNEENKHVRDLAASLLEKTKILNARTEEKLYIRMTTDSHHPVRFRSAFALRGHNYGKHQQEVTKVLQQATKDPDIKKIAENYLKK